jgi:hypothetical protein
VDTFTFSANDCPTSAQSWSDNEGTIEINVVPKDIAGKVTVARYGTTVIDMSEWSLSTESSSTVLIFTIVDLPVAGLLKDEDGKAIAPSSAISSSKVLYNPDSSCDNRNVSFSYITSDPKQSEPVKVYIEVDCPRQCDDSDLVYEVKACEDGARKVMYSLNETRISDGDCVAGKYRIPSSYTGTLSIVKVITLVLNHSLALL